MPRSALALAAVLALSACADEDPASYPPVEANYTITDAGVECRGTVDEDWSPTRHACTWERVTVEGEPTCTAILVFRREDEGSPWSLSAAFTTDVDRCD